MKEKYKFLLKNTGVLTISSFSTKLLSFFLVPLYTAILTTEDYGLVELISSTVTLVIPFLTLNIIDSIVVFGIKYKQIDKIASIVIRYVLGSFIVFAVLLIGNKVLNIWDLKGLSIYVFIYFVAVVTNDMLNEFAKATERINDIAIAGFISSAVTIALNIFFLVVIKWGIKGYFLAMLLGACSSSLYLFFRLKVWRHISLNFDKDLNKAMLHYAFPLITTTIGWIINSNGDKYVAAYFYGASVTGLISVAYKIPNIISIFNTIFSRSWQVSAVKEYDSEGKKQFYASVYVALNFFLTFIAACLIAFDKILSKFLFSNDFYQAWQLVPFLILSSVFSFIAGYMGPILSARFDNKTIAKSTLYSAFLNIILNIALSFVFGPQGLTIATMLSGLFIYFYRRRVVGSLIGGYDFIVYLSWIVLIIQAIMRIYVPIEILSWIPILIILLIYSKQIKMVKDKALSILKAKKVS